MKLYYGEVMLIDNRGKNKIIKNIMINKEKINFKIDVRIDNGYRGTGEVSINWGGYGEVSIENAEKFLNELKKTIKKAKKVIKKF